MDESEIDVNGIDSNGITSNGENGNNQEDLSQLRCSSIRTEVLSQREQRRRFQQQNMMGGPLLQSQTLMRLQLIGNELHNISRTQLKQTEGEIDVLQQRVENFHERLDHEGEILTECNKSVTELAEEAKQDGTTETEVEEDANLEELKCLSRRLQVYKEWFNR